MMRAFAERFLLLSSGKGQDSLETVYASDWALGAQAAAETSLPGASTVQLQPLSVADNRDHDLATSSGSSAESVSHETVREHGLEVVGKEDETLDFAASSGLSPECSAKSVSRETVCLRGFVKVSSDRRSPAIWPRALDMILSAALNRSLTRPCACTVQKRVRVLARLAPCQPHGLTH